MAGVEPGRGLVGDQRGPHPARSPSPRSGAGSSAGARAARRTPRARGRTPRARSRHSAACPRPIAASEIRSSWKASMIWWKPRFSAPRTASAGTEQSSSTTSRVSEECQPILRSGRPIDRPGVPRSTSEQRDAASARPAGGVAATMSTSARPALVMNILRPSQRPSPRRAARGAGDAGDVGAGARLGDGDRGDRLARGERAEPALAAARRCRAGRGAGRPCRR